MKVLQQLAGASLTRGSSGGEMQADDEPLELA